jgi:RNA polymerase sigma-70 factor (ECF subfamily)
MPVPAAWCRVVNDGDAADSGFARRGTPGRRHWIVTVLMLSRLASRTWPASPPCRVLSRTPERPELVRDTVAITRRCRQFQNQAAATMTEAVAGECSLPAGCNISSASGYASIEMMDSEHSQPGETALVCSAQAGDHDAFAALLDAHLPQVRTFLALKAPVPQLVDELAHDTFVFAFRHLDEFKPGTSFRAWVRAIAWNLLRAEVQRFAREQVNRERFAAWRLAEWETCANETVPAAEAEHLEDCLAQLDGPLRELVLLKYRDDQSTESIAARLKRSLVWVRVSLFRVRRKLRECIEARRGGRQPC